MSDYRYDPFLDTEVAVNITDETHIIPSNSPYTIRLCEVPKKDTPSSIVLKIGATTLAEVAATPASMQYRPDYTTGADSDPDWNTGTILFNSAQAGQTVTVSYKGTGTLADAARIGIHKQMFTASGTFTVPAGVNRVWVTMCGGGGKGGASYHGTEPTVDNNGGGGGGGASIFSVAVTVTPGANIAVTVGAGGTTGAGGASSFGSLASCTGGAVGGNAGNNNGEVGAGGASGGVGGEPGTAGGKGGSTLYGFGAPASAGALYGSGGAGGTSAGGFSGASGFVLVEW